jgi:2,4-dienoyl-CoA reductase-like NADH-dependent reductase (Old Yellow Enzyme family)
VLSQRLQDSDDHDQIAEKCGKPDRHHGGASRRLAIDRRQPWAAALPTARGSQDVATGRHAIVSSKLDMFGMTQAHIVDPHIVKNWQTE